MSLTYTQREVPTQQLAVLVAVADRGHLGRAAAELHVPQQAVRRTLRDLEALTGERLLDERARSTRLTPSGQRLAISARRVLDAYERFDAAAQADTETLRVAHVANSATLSVLLDRFVARHPEARIAEQMMPDTQQILAVTDQRLDVAVCSIADAIPAELASCRLRYDPLVVAGIAGPPVHRHRTPLTFAAYGAAWPSFDVCVDGYEQALGHRLHRTRTLGSGRPHAALLRQAGNRHPVVASSTLDETPIEVSALADRPPALEWHLVWRRERRAPVVDAFIALALAVAEALGWLDRSVRAAPAPGEAVTSGAGADINHA
jgi:DNA-binding transcriptional LysR family regulator